MTAAVGESVPICTGENEYTMWGFRSYMKNRAANIINPDPVKCGGLWQAKKIAALAEAHQILCTPHSVCSEVGLETALHLTASTPNCAYAEIFYPILYYMEGLTESILARPLDIKKGFLKASNRPGFGVELDEKIVNRFRVNK